MTPSLPAIAALLLTAALATAAPAAEMIPPAPWRAKDFAVTRAYGIYHLFYIRDDVTKSSSSTENDFGHAVSTDLVTWTELDPLLPVRPTAWDDLHMWAPSIVSVPGGWAMLYTGVTANNTANGFQRVGLALSGDLSNWSRVDPPVFQCTQAPWTWCDSTATLGGEFRDPFVMPDPGTPGAWLMYYAARCQGATWQMQIGVARSTGDLTQWQDLGALANTDFAHSLASTLESPHVCQHGGLWYLFYSVGGMHPIRWQIAPTPLAPAALWSPQATLASEMPGTDHLFASEMLHDGTRDYFMAANDSTNGISIYEVAWDASPDFHFVDPAGALAVSADRGGSSPGLGLETLGPRVSPAPVLRYVLPAAMHARLELMDVAGRRVRVLRSDTDAAGAHAVQWDGHDESGGETPAGVYFARLTTPLGTRSARVTLAR